MDGGDCRTAPATPGLLISFEVCFKDSGEKSLVGKTLCDNDVKVIFTQKCGNAQHILVDFFGCCYIWSKMPI